MRYRLQTALLFGLSFLSVLVHGQTTATFGDVISLGTQPSDVVLDQGRQRLYMINTAASRVDVYDYAGQNLVGSIQVAQTPLAGAISMDGNFLYVSNHDSG